MARVDGKTYTLLGMPITPKGAFPANLNPNLGTQYTVARTFFSMLAGNATILLDFFTPVTPNDLVKQSMPFSYLTVSASGSSNVQVYVDFDDTWSGQTGSTVSQFSSSNGYSMYELSVEGAPTYAVKDDQALWGSAVFATGNSSATGVQSGNGNMYAMRSAWATNGSLAGGNNNYQTGDVVAFASPITSTSNATFVIGYVRDEVVNYMGQPQTGYYRSVYSDTFSAVQAFINGYSNTSVAAQLTQGFVANNSISSAGTEYSTITKLATRQAYGGCDITIPKDTLDTNSTMIFVDEMSSGGGIQTTDVVYPIFPIWYVMSPQWFKYTLEPLLQYLQSGKWSLPYFVQSLGTYPNAIGTSDSSSSSATSQNQPVENSGNALILAYAYTNITGDTAWAQKYTPLLKKYAADYLVTNGLNQGPQLSSDVVNSGPVTNQTNLAIKSAIALNMFGKMSGNTNYSTIGQSFAKQLYTNGLATDTNKSHFTFTYGISNATSSIPAPIGSTPSSSYVQTYDLLPDSLFNLSTFPADALTMQSNFYATQFSNSTVTPGVPRYSGANFGDTTATLWAAALASNTTRTVLVQEIQNFLNQTSGANEGVPYADRWRINGPNAGQWFQNKNRPTVGGHYAIMAHFYGPGSITP